MATALVGEAFKNANVPVVDCSCVNPHSHFSFSFFFNCQASYTGKINTITSATSTAPAEKRAKNGCEDSRESKKLMAVKTVERAKKG